MKTRERLERIKKSKSWTERMKLARDHLPGTRLDAIFEQIMDTLRSMEESGYRPKGREDHYILQTGRIDIAAMNHDHMAAFGENFAIASKNGNSDLFREWADAVDAWHSHRPFEDKLRAAIIRFCIPPNGKFQMRDIIQHLRDKKIIPAVIKESAGLADIRRNVRRICNYL